MRNLKRALSLALASVMLLGMMVVGTSAAAYPDVDSQDNLEAIEVLKAVGVMTGDNNGNFNPDANVTRNEMAVILCTLLGLTPGGSHPFNDVPEWAAPYVAACYNNGIIAGVSATQFNGDASVTAVQAGLMTMKPLGYFGHAGEFADDWKIATVKQADKIDLYKGINAYTDQNMNRNDVAQMVLNALECTIQVVTEEGGMSVDGNGISVVVKPTYKYEDADNRDGKDYRGSSATAAQKSTMQLCEKLFGTDLKKNTDTVDDFGRPSTEWTYDTTTIKSPKASDVTYTKKVEGGDIYKDLGRVTVDHIEYYNNSASTSAVPAKFAVANSNSVEIGNKGTLTEVYYDKDSKTATIVSIDYYLAKAAEDYNDKDENVDVTVYSHDVSSATLDLEDFSIIETIKEDDYLVVTISDDEVKSVAPAEMVENAVVSSARKNENVTADGTKYEYNGVSKGASEALGNGLMTGSSSYDLNGDGYNLYLDPNGYVLGVEGYDGGTNVEDYIFIKEVGNSAFDKIAKALFTDGSTKTITVDKYTNGGTDIDHVAWNNATVANQFYTFKTDSDGNYELTAIPVAASNDKKVAQDKTGDNVADLDNMAQPIRNHTTPSNVLSGHAYAGIASTVFIAKDKVFTGVKNAPEVKGTTVYYVLDENDRLMIVYTADKGSTSTGADDLVYILTDNPTETKDGDDTYYVYPAIKNGEEVDLEANDNGMAPGLYEIETYTDGRADLVAPINGTTVTNDLVHYLGFISSASHKDGTLTLGGSSFLLADNAKFFTIDGTTVKTISAGGVERAVTKDGFTIATAVEVSSSDDNINIVYLAKSGSSGVDFNTTTSAGAVNTALNSGNVTLKSGATISTGTVTVPDGKTLTVESGATLSAGASVTVKGNLVLETNVSGSIDLDGGSVKLDGVTTIPTITGDGDVEIATNVNADITGLKATSAAVAATAANKGQVVDASGSVDNALELSGIGKLTTYSNTKSMSDLAAYTDSTTFKAMDFTLPTVADATNVKVTYYTGSAADLTTVGASSWKSPNADYGVGAADGRDEVSGEYDSDVTVTFYVGNRVTGLKFTITGGTNAGDYFFKIK